MENAQLLSMSDVKRELLRIDATSQAQVKNWTFYEIFSHCSQTIECSMTGYPVMKPKLLRNTIGRLVIKKFLRQGYMKHNLSAHVPGGEAISKSGSTGEGIQRLIQSIDKFQAFNGKLAPHLIFGNLSKDEYDKYFTMHVANHLSEVQYSTI